MIASRVISLIIVVHIAMSEAGTSSDIIRMCGGKLSDMIRMVCRNTGYAPAFDSDNDGPILGRFRRQVADECCQSGCSMSTLELYCAPSSSQYSNKSPVKRTTDESGNEIKSKGLVGRLLNSVTDSATEMKTSSKFPHSKDVKRQVSGENGVESFATGSSSGSNSESKRESGMAVYDEIKSNDDGDKVVEEELNKQNQGANNAIESKNTKGMPSSQQRITWHSLLPASASGLSTNAVPNLSDLRESTSSQSSSLNNDLLSSINKRTTHAPLQIGVETPYFLGKQLFQPKTRHTQESNTAKNAQRQNEK